MTIKEMCKVYKKLEKLEDEFTNAKINLTAISVYGDMDYINENAKKLAKVTATISKYAKAMDVDTQTLMENVISEEHFCRWCLISDIVMSGNEADEAEEE